MSKLFAKESDLCAAFIADATKDGKWVAYPETAGFDIVMVRAADGIQVGIEAKLVLNVAVLLQALPKYRWEGGVTGPDYRAVLVPADKCSTGLPDLCEALGITVIRQRGAHADDGAYPHLRYVQETFRPSLPDERWGRVDGWHEWCPVNRCELPAYVPDVGAGMSAPVALTTWKVQAIKLAILLEERPVTRKDMKALRLSPSRWTDGWTGWLTPTPAGYVANKSMPDFKGQHPVNYEQIKADKAMWVAAEITKTEPKGALL